jgi:hypothetical protein
VNVAKPPPGHEKRVRATSAVILSEAKDLVMINHKQILRFGQDDSFMRQNEKQNL